MAAEVGRKWLIRRDGVQIAGVRTKSITINNEPIDATTGDDDAVRRLLADAGQKTIDMTIEGLTQDDILLQAAAEGTPLIEPWELEAPSGAIIAGDFRLNNLELGMPYNEATTFSSEVQSTGVWTYTAAV